ncbi:MAG: hypothetical protein IJC50_09675 [Clostridia bacterium]|nr:hypothetical protein [Clostridia bacterium]
MKNKLKALLPLLFVIALLAVIPFAVNAEECNHENTMHYDYIEPACHYSGIEAHEVCLDCGRMWPDNPPDFGLFDPYIPPLGGEVEHVTAKEPTCSELGNIEYWHCENCDQYWTDEALTRLTNRLSVRIGTLEHTEVYVARKEPTCTENGNIEHWYCSECGTKRSHYGGYLEVKYVIPATGHNYVEGVCMVCGECEHTNIVYVEPTMGDCHLQGYREHWYCSDCDGYWLDEDLTYQVSRHSVILFRPAGFEPDVQHIETVEPTCVSEGNIEYWHCEECDRYWTDEALTQLTNRKNVLIAALDHDFVYVDAVEPECHYTGNIAYKYCYVCDTHWTMDGMLTNRKAVILPEKGSDQVVHVEAKEPTCTEDGNIEYWHCGECDQYWLDYVGLRPEIIIPALGHDYVDGVCTVCGEKKETTVTADGLDITVSGLDGVRDFLIAPGHHEVYSGIKQNYILRVTNAKFGVSDRYTASMTSVGEYTVLVRYTDGSEQTYHYVTTEAATPEFAVSGLSVTVSDFSGLRTLRTAPGKWNTPGEVKRAAGARNIPARNIGNDPYKLQYAEDGVYTVSLEYLNGLVVVEHFELSRTIPYVYQKGNKITLGDLDDLYVVRYAPGIYETMGEIKRAEGSKYIRPSAIDENGEISFEIGYEMYTICVQYNDGSQYYDYCIGKNDHFDLDEVKSLLEKYGLTVDADLFENKEPGALQDGASLTVTLESKNISHIPQVTIKVKRQEEWFLLIQKNPQNLVFSTINNTYIEAITLEWILQGLDGEELDAKLDELYLNSDPLWDISRQYNDFDIVPLELSITIGDETEIITVYPVYEVVY